MDDKKNIMLASHVQHAAHIPTRRPALPSPALACPRRLAFHDAGPYDATDEEDRDSGWVGARTRSDGMHARHCTALHCTT